MIRSLICTSSLCLSCAFGCAAASEAAYADTAPLEDTSHPEDATSPSHSGEAAASASATAVESRDAGAASEVSEHVALLRKRIAASNAQDWDTWQSLHTADAVRTAPGLPGPIVGAAAMRTAIEELFTTFPDYHLELVDAFGAGDRLAARVHTRATMSGPLQLGEDTVPATGKVFEQDWVAMLRFEGNRIAAIDEFYDNYEVLVQLGLFQ
jgi:ketosteroid isomerase-like protein